MKFVALALALRLQVLGLGFEAKSLALEGRPWHKSSRPLTWLIPVFFLPNATNCLSLSLLSVSELVVACHTVLNSRGHFILTIHHKSFNEGKKLHTDECYVCIISFIRSLMTLTNPWNWCHGLCLGRMRPWLWGNGLDLGLGGMRPWLWPWPGCHGLGLDGAGFVNITAWNSSFTENLIKCDHNTDLFQPRKTTITRPLRADVQMSMNGFSRCERWKCPAKFHVDSSTALVLISWTFRSEPLWCRFRAFPCRAFGVGLVVSCLAIRLA